MNFPLHIIRRAILYGRYHGIILSCSNIIHLNLRKIVLQIRLICRHLCLMYIRQILRCQYSHQHCHDSYYNDQLYNENPPFPFFPFDFFMTFLSITLQYIPQASGPLIFIRHDFIISKVNVNKLFIKL